MASSLYRHTIARRAHCDNGRGEEQQRREVKRRARDVPGTARSNGERKDLGEQARSK